MTARRPTADRDHRRHGWTAREGHRHAPYAFEYPCRAIRRTCTDPVDIGRGRVTASHRRRRSPGRGARGPDGTRSTPPRRHLGWGTRDPAGRPRSISAASSWVVVAESPEVARQARASCASTTTRDPMTPTSIPAETISYAPDDVNAGFPTDTEDGDVDAALRRRRGHGRSRCTSDRDANTTIRWNRTPPSPVYAAAADRF